MVFALVRSRGTPVYSTAGSASAVVGASVWAMAVWDRVAGPVFLGVLPFVWTGGAAAAVVAMVAGALAGALPGMACSASFCGGGDGEV